MDNSILLANRFRSKYLYIITTRLTSPIIRKVFPHLKNLFRNVIILGSINSHPKHSKLKKLLTIREYEIVELISKGLPPVKIRERFGITLSTVYKHIANIYTKLNISSCQELLLMVYDSGEFEKNPDFTTLSNEPVTTKIAE